jgi:hypothetical protein
MEKILKSYLILSLIPLLAAGLYLKSHPTNHNFNTLATGQLFTDEIENLSSIKKLQPLSYIENPYQEQQ